MASESIRRVPSFVDKLKKRKTKLIESETIFLKSLNFNIARLESLEKSKLTDSDQKSLDNDKKVITSFKKSLGKQKVNDYVFFEKLWTKEVSYLASSGHTELTIDKIDTAAYKEAVIYELGEPNHPILQFMRYTKALYQQLNQDAKERYEDKVGKRLFFDEIGYLNKTKQLLCDTKSYMNIVLGLCAATGRRPGEILLTAKFEPIEGNTIEFNNYSLIVPSLLSFSGQLKTKAKLYEKPAYSIPTLVDRDLVLSAFYRLRSLKDFTPILNEMYKTFDPIKAVAKATTKLNQKTGNTQKEAMRRYFEPYFDNSITPYDLRHVYPLLITDYFCDESVKTDEVRSMFYPILLGHSKGDQTTKICYQDFKMEYKSMSKRDYEQTIQD